MTRQKTISCGILALLAACSAGYAQSPVTSAFTYQGELASAGTPATGLHDVRFRLYDAATGGMQIGSTLCSDNLAVSAGRFAASLDFGAAAFAGEKRYLEIEVRLDTGLGCGDSTGYTVLSPRQELTAAPNAVFAQNAATANTAATAANAASLNGQSPSFYQNAANLTGTLGDARLSSNIARLNGNQTFTGQLNFINSANTFAGSGAGLTNLSGASINAGTLARSSLSADLQSGVGTLIPEVSQVASSPVGGLPRSVAVSGSFAYVTTAVAAGGTLQVFNISDPAAPTLEGSVATGNDPFSVVVSGSFAYVVNQYSDTLQVFDINNPAAPTLVGTVATDSQPLSLAVSGSFAYVLNVAPSTLQVFSISNPAAPTLVATIGTDSQPVSIAVSGSFAYVANADSSTLQVFDITDPSAAVLTGSVVAGGTPWSVAVSGSFAYVSSWGLNALQVFNISNPAAPTLVGSVATQDFPSSIAISGSLAYVVGVGSGNKLEVFNISNPTTPTLAENVATQNAPSSVAVSGSLTYIVGGGAALEVFRTSTRVGFGAPLAASTLAGVSGMGLTNLSASSVTSGTIDNARTTATTANTANTLVLRDASGSFTAPFAENATNAQNAINATNLANQPASFYTNASNLTTGVLANNRTSASTANIANSIVLRNAGGSFTAPFAENSTNAQNAVNAANAQNAINATNAQNAVTATNAQNANNATNAQNAVNATNLANQPASFYTNASNLTTGVLANSRTSASTANIPFSIVLRDAAGSFTATRATNATNATYAANLSPTEFIQINTGTNAAPNRLAFGYIGDLTGGAESTDAVFLQRVSASNDNTDLRLYIGDNPANAPGAGGDAFSIWTANATPTSGTERFRFQSDGNAFKPGGGSWTALCDPRAKHDIAPLTGTLDRLLTLRGYTFEYNEDRIASGLARPGTQIGLMADEVARVFPDWVSTDATGTRFVSERGTTALMVEALRDLRVEKDAEIKALKAEKDAEVKSLHARLEQLERTLEARTARK